MDEYLTPVCSPDYLADGEFPKTPRDLGGCTLLHDGDAWELAGEDAEWRLWLDAVGAVDVDSNEGQFFTLANLAIEAALTHQGIAMGRLSLVEELLATYRLVAPFPQRIKAPGSYRLVYPSELADRPGIMEVANWLREEAREVREARVEQKPHRHIAVISG